MSADDGWCKHFDKEERACTIYEERPRFCRVETETFGDMYGVDPEDMDDFCSACCSEQIGDVYGGKRQETDLHDSPLHVVVGCCLKLPLDVFGFSLVKRRAIESPREMEKVAVMPDLWKSFLTVFIPVRSHTVAHLHVKYLTCCSVLFFSSCLTPPSSFFTYPVFSLFFRTCLTPSVILIPEYSYSLAIA